MTSARTKCRLRLMIAARLDLRKPLIKTTLDVLFSGKDQTNCGPGLRICDSMTRMAIKLLSTELQTKLNICKKRFSRMWRSCESQNRSPGTVDKNCLLR